MRARQDELQDVTNNQANYTDHQLERVDPPSSCDDFSFGGTCPLRNEDGDGCVQTPVPVEGDLQADR